MVNRREAGMLGFGLSAPGYTVADVLDWFDGQSLSPQELALAPTALTGPFELPVFVIQGDEDFTTPTSVAKAFVESVDGPRKKFVTIRGGHFAVFMNASEFLKEMRASLTLASQKAIMRFTKAALTIGLFVWSSSASAQSLEKEPAAIVEVGGTGNWSVKGGGSAFGPTAAVEVTPIKNWLELEAGVTPLFAKGATEWDTDLLFKKPWDISRKMEFMLGVGPAWIHTNKLGATRNSISGELAPDFMFWPSAKRRFGWYIEPSYEYNFARGHEQSIGVTVGLLISIR